MAARAGIFLHYKRHLLVISGRIFLAWPQCWHVGGGLLCEEYGSDSLQRTSGKALAVYFPNNIFLFSEGTFSISDWQLIDFKVSPKVLWISLDSSTFQSDFVVNAWRVSIDLHDLGAR